MAQTKSSTKESKAKRGAAAGGSGAKPAGKSKSKPASRSKATRSRPKSSRSKAGSSSSRPSSQNGSSNGVANGVKTARSAVEGAGGKVGKAASKAKMPLIAGGAAMVGAASGLAIGAARSNHSKVLGVKLPKPKFEISSKDLAKAADRVAGAGEQIGNLSSGIRELQGGGEGQHENGRHRSPIEVLIQGLTRRR